MSDHIIRALCNTLMHSLWQGILLAVITGAIIIFTKKASAAYRYNLLIGALTLFAFGVTATFIAQLQKPAASSAYLSYSTHSRTGSIPPTAAHAIGVAPVPLQTAGTIAQRTGTGYIADTVISYFNTHYNIIVLIWFLIICAKSVQMAVGLYSVYYLKRTNVFKVAEDWENRLLQLAKQLHIEQAIRLMESGIAKAPIVVGHLKPVILIPIGLINSLATDEVEAILIHELAHIRRRDYLVNLLQNFMEIVFFFNPAVLWISRLIKTERENCCDDLAIAQSRNKANYIRALVSCEEYQAAGADLVMAFPGTKNSLRNRVKRMVGKRNHSLNLFEKTILAVCLVVMGVGISAFTARERIERENTKKAMKPVAPVVHYDARVENRQSATDREKKRGTANSPLARPAKPDTNKADTTKPAFDATRAIAWELYRENLLVDTNRPSITLNDRELIVNGVRMAQQVYERIYNQFGPRSHYGGSLVHPYNDQPSYSSDSNRYHNQNVYYQSLAEEQKRVEENIDKKLVADLLQDGLITDPKNVSFTLNDKALIINGKNQSGELYKKYKEKYRPGNTGSGWSWNYSNHE
jgi:bla regulator protein blaR1